MRWFVLLTLLALTVSLRAADPAPAPPTPMADAADGPFVAPYHSFGACCGGNPQRNWWQVPPGASHLAWQGYCGDCNFQQQFGGCPGDYVPHFQPGPIVRATDRIRCLFFGDFFGDDCGGDGYGGGCGGCQGCDGGCSCNRCRTPVERACGCARSCGCPRATCGSQPTCGCDARPAEKGEGSDAPPPPMPPALETELPQSRKPSGLRAISLPKTVAASPARESVTIRTAAHIEVPAEEPAEEPRLLTPPTLAARRLPATTGKLPVIVTPSTPAAPPTASPAPVAVQPTPAPQPEAAPAKPISGNSLRFRLLK